MSSDAVVRRGEVLLCDFGTPIGHQPAYRRPAVVVSPEELNRYGSPIVLPVTRTRHGYPTHIEIEGTLPVTSYVQCELLRAVSAERLVKPLAQLDPMDLGRIDVVLRRILALAVH